MAKWSEERVIKGARFIANIEDSDEGPIVTELFLLDDGGDRETADKVLNELAAKIDRPASEW